MCQGFGKKKMPIQTLFYVPEVTKQDGTAHLCVLEKSKGAVRENGVVGQIGTSEKKKIMRHYGYGQGGNSLQKFGNHSYIPTCEI